MKKKCILAGSVLFVLAVLYLVLRIAEAKKEAAVTVPDMLLSVTADEIREVSFSASDGEWLTFAREDGIWVCREHPEEALDQVAVRTFCAGFTGIGVQRTFTDVDDLSSYGLAEPAAEARITDAEGKETVLYVSGINETAGMVYVRIGSGTGTVYAVFSSFSANLRKTFSDFL